MFWVETGICIFMILTALSVIVKDVFAKIRNTETASACVLGYSEKQITDKNGITTTKYYLRLSYRVQGKDYTVTDSDYSEKKDYETGQKIDIKYNPKKPESYYICGKRLHLVAAFGIILISAGILALVILRR